MKRRLFFVCCFAMCFTAAVAQDPYCSSRGSSSASEWIQEVSLGIPTNVSGNNGGYASFAIPGWVYNKGSAYNFALTPGYSAGSTPVWWKIWIDLNHDFDFTDAGELVYNSGSAATGQRTGSITIPSTATATATRMRVSMKYNASMTECETFSYGEVEDYSVTLAASCTDTYEANESSGTAKTISVNTNVSAKICNPYDTDWFKFTTLSAAPKVKITLTTLPANYNVYLYNSALSLLGSGTNTGTTSETITYNGSTVGATYYVKILPASVSDYSTTSNYTLRAATQSANWLVGSSIPDPSKTALTDVEETMEAYPNPAHNMLNVRIGATAAQDGVLKLLDLSGRVLVHQHVSLTLGTNSIALDVANLPNGMYIAQLQTGRTLHHLKVEVMH